MSSNPLASHEILAPLAPVAHQDATAPAADVASRGDQFVAVTGPQSDQVSAPIMVIVAYALFWMLAIAFVYFTHRKQCRLHARVDELEKRLRDSRRDPKEINPS